MPIEWHFYLAAIPAVILTGISKGGFAGGLGLLAVPLLSLVVSPLDGAAIMLPLLMVMDGMGLWVYRNKVDWLNFRHLMPGALIGTLIGWLTADSLTPDHLRIAVGAIAVVFAADHWLSKRSQLPASGPNALRGAFWGSISGIVSFIAHAGSPPVQVHLLPQRQAPQVYVATTVYFFALINWLKVPAYLNLGQFTTANLSASLVLTPVAIGGMALGIWLQNRLDPKLFFKIAYGLAFLVGLELLRSGIMGLLSRA